MADYKNMIGELAGKCLKQGADEAEIYLQTERRMSIDIRNGDIETVEEAASSGLGIRVFVKKRMGFASSNDLGPAALDKAVSKAVSFARIMTEDPSNMLPARAGQTSVGRLYDPELAGVPLDRKIELAKAVEKLAMKDPRITKSDGARYSQAEGEVYIANSNGLLSSYKSSFCSLGVSVLAEKGEQRSSGGNSCSRRFFAELDTPEKIAEKAARKAWQMLDPRRVKTQKAPVIFDRDVSPSLIEGIISALNGESVLQGTSFLAGKIGRRIAVGPFTLTDDGTVPGGPASAPFDDEGVPISRHVFVDGGVLKGFMYNTAAALRAGTKSTGNASRSGYASLPGIGIHNFHMAAGEMKLDDIIAGTARGILVKELTGYGINPVNGNFSGGVSGFWIENGRLVHPVMGLTVAGSADEILNGMDAIADDPDTSRALAAPSLRIRELQIGGE